MIEKKQNNLGHEIIKNNIILYGVENYYNLIEKMFPSGKYLELFARQQKKGWTAWGNESQ